jgi:endonuclease YncB( thermonuclease family)
MTKGIGSLWRGSLCAGLLIITGTHIAEAQSREYVASARGSVYYWVGCSAWKKVSTANRIYFGSAQHAENAGYRPSRSPGCAGPSVQRRITTATQQGERCIVEEVVDGDTFRCSQFGSIRLLLIDAPELQQGPYGVAAKRAAQALLIPGETVQIEFDVQRLDRYHRTLAYVRTRDGRLVNRELARRGLAVTVVYPPNVKHVDLIRAAVDSARAEGLQLWSKGGHGCAPADFRARKCQVN